MPMKTTKPSGNKHSQNPFRTLKLKIGKLEIYKIALHSKIV